MSEENVEIVRRHTKAWNRRDLKTWLALFHPDAELDWSRSRGPLKGVYRGHGEREGIEVIARSAFVFTVENGQITRQRMFQERAEALKAAGVSE
jgi:ketosteroid isomerase-like protein